MYSHEIERLLKIKNYLLSSSDYSDIIATSPQIDHVRYDKNNDIFELNTDDKYTLKFKVKVKNK